jgi:hypothetical protein
MVIVDKNYLPPYAYISMSVENPFRDVLTCKRCGHQWVHSKQRPSGAIRCTRCSSRRWDQEPDPEPSLESQRQKLVDALAAFDRLHPEVVLGLLQSSPASSLIHTTEGAQQPTVEKIEARTREAFREYFASNPPDGDPHA